MSDRIRVGVISTSWWVDGYHLPGLTSHPQAQVVAICGRNSDRAAEVAAKYGVPNVFSDYRKMIDAGGLDAILVASPDDQHYAMAMDALEAKLHLICEKPLALTADEALRMYEKAEAAGVTHMTFFTFRWTPLMQRVKALIDEGYVGKIRSCEFHFLFSEGPDPSYRWRADPKRCHGVLSDAGSHMFDMARWLVGDFAAVSAHLATYGSYLGPDGQPFEAVNDDAVVLAKFEHGAHGTFHLSVATHQGERSIQQRYVFFGDQGTLEVEMPFVGSATGGAVLRGVRKGAEAFYNLPISEQPELDALYHRELFAHAFDAIRTQPIGDRLFIDAVLAGRKVAPSLYDGWKAQQVVDAALRSHESGCWVAV
jgi:predicted dehydrogenase